MIASRTRQPKLITTPAPIETFGPILADGSTLAVSSMKHGSMISGPAFESFGRGAPATVGERRRRSEGFVTLYDARMSELAGIAELHRVSRRLPRWVTTHAADLIWVQGALLWYT